MKPIIIKNDAIPTVHGSIQRLNPIFTIKDFEVLIVSWSTNVRSDVPYFREWFEVLTGIKAIIDKYCVGPASSDKYNESIASFFGVRDSAGHSFISEALSLLVSTYQGVDHVLNNADLRSAIVPLRTCHFERGMYCGYPLGYVVNTRYWYNLTHHHLKNAIIDRELNIVTSLLALKRSLNHAYDNSKYPDLVSLSQSSIDVDYYFNHEEKSLIDYAIDSQDEEIVNLLLAENVSLNRNWNAKALYPLHRAVMLNNKNIKMAIYSACPDMLMSPNYAGDTPLHWIAVLYPSELKEFIRPDFAVNLRNNKNESVFLFILKYKLKTKPICVFDYASKSRKQTFLHKACINNDEKAIELLLEHGADVNAVDVNGKKPFDLLNDRSKAAFWRLFADYKKRHSYDEIERYTDTNDDQKFDEAHWERLCEKIFSVYGITISDTNSKTFRFRFLATCSKEIDQPILKYHLALKLDLYDKYLPLLDDIEKHLSTSSQDAGQDLILKFDTRLSSAVDDLYEELPIILILLAISKNRNISIIIALYCQIMETNNTEDKSGILSVILRFAAKHNRPDIVRFLGSRHHLPSLYKRLYSFYSFELVKRGDARMIEAIIQSASYDDISNYYRCHETNMQGYFKASSLLGYAISLPNSAACQVIVERFPHLLTEFSMKNGYNNTANLTIFNDDDHSLFDGDGYPLVLALTTADVINDLTTKNQLSSENAHLAQTDIRKIIIFLLSQHLKQNITHVFYDGCHSVPISDILIGSTCEMVKIAVGMGVDFSAGTLGEVYNTNETPLIYDYLYDHYGDDKFKGMVNRRNSFGRFLLHFLYAANQINGIKSLLLRGADLEVKNGNGLTILTLAIDSNDISTVMEILAVVKNVNVSYLLNAITLGRIEIVTIIKHHCTFTKNTLFRACDLAMQHNHLAILKTLLNDHPDYLLDPRNYEALVAKARSYSKPEFHQLLKATLNSQKKRVASVANQEAENSSVIKSTTQSVKAKKEIKIPTSLQVSAALSAASTASLSHKRKITSVSAKMIDKVQWRNYLNKLFCHALELEQIIESVIDGRLCFSINLIDAEVWRNVTPPKAMSDKKFNITVSSEQRQHVLEVMRSYLIDNCAADVIVKSDFIQIIPKADNIPHIGVLHSQVFKALGGEKAIQSAAAVKPLVVMPTPEVQAVNVTSPQNDAVVPLTRKQRRKLTQEQQDQSDSQKETVRQFKFLLDTIAKAKLSNFEVEKILKSVMTIMNGNGLRMEFDLMVKLAYKANSSDEKFYKPADIMSSLFYAMNHVAAVYYLDCGPLIQREITDKSYVIMIDFTIVSISKLLALSDAIIDHFCVQPAKLYHKPNEAKLESTMIEKLLSKTPDSKAETKSKSMPTTSRVIKFTLFGKPSINDRNRDYYLASLRKITPTTNESAESHLDYLNLLFNGMRLFHLEAKLCKKDTELAKIYHDARIFLRHGYDYFQNWSQLYTMIKPLLDGLNRGEPDSTEILQFRNAISPYRQEIDTKKLGINRSRVRFRNISTLRGFIEEVQASTLPYESKRDLTLMLHALIDDAILHGPTKLRNKSNEKAELASWALGHKGHYKLWNEYADRLYVDLKYPSREAEAAKSIGFSM